MLTEMVQFLWVQSVLSIMDIHETQDDNESKDSTVIATDKITIPQPSTSHNIIQNESQRPKQMDMDPSETNNISQELTIPELKVSFSSNGEKIYQCKRSWN